MSYSMRGVVSICQVDRQVINLPITCVLGMTYAGCKHGCICPDSESDKERAPNVNLLGKKSNKQTNLTTPGKNSCRILQEVPFLSSLSTHPSLRASNVVPYYRILKLYFFNINLFILIGG